MTARDVGGRPLYLELEPDPVFAFVHEPMSPPALGVVLCPPFGWDEECSYRARRTWADALARAGHAAIRIDLPGTGDSAGWPHDPHRVDAWTGAVAGTAQWLRTELGCTRIVAIGIGIGGILACCAAAGGAGIDDLVLWAVPARGRALVREMRAFAALELHRSEPVGGSGDGLEVAGQVLTEETVKSLERIDLTSLAFEEGSRRRVLLVARDGIAPDRQLRDHLGQAGFEVTVAPGEGYGLMMDDPRLSAAPTAVIARSIAWLAGAQATDVRSAADGASGADAGSARNAPVRSSEVLELEHDGTAIRELPVTVDGASGRLFGILTEPAGGAPAGLCALLMNAGSVRRIGPSRGWVELARRWAARGVPSLRIDFDGIGDADGAERQYVSTFDFYQPKFPAHAVAALDELTARGVASRFVVVGLCSGAYWAFQCALADPRVASAMAINLDTFFWSPGVAADRIAARARRGRTRSQIVSRVLAPEGVRLGAEWLKLSVRAARRGGLPQEQRISAALDALRDRRTNLLLLFSRGEAMYDELVEEGVIENLQRWPNIRVDHISGTDHMVRDVRLQRYLHRILDEALDRALTISSPEPGPRRNATQLHAAEARPQAN